MGDENIDKLVGIIPSPFRIPFCNSFLILFLLLSFVLSSYSSAHFSLQFFFLLSFVLLYIIFLCCPSSVSPYPLLTTFLLLPFINCLSLTFLLYFFVVFFALFLHVFPSSLTPFILQFLASPSAI
jgi:hypothetical protein